MLFKQNFYLFFEEKEKIEFINAVLVWLTFMLNVTGLLMKDFSELISPKISRWRKFGSLVQAERLTLHFLVHYGK